MQIDVYALPEYLPPRPDYDYVVAIDVLRATSVVTTALAVGACRVVPCRTVECAQNAKKAARAKDPSSEDRLLLGGERDAVKIEGFDLGNSPGEYRSETVAGKSIFFTTTNGTRALLCGAGKRTIAASFLNAEAVVQWLVECGKADARLAIVCAGTCRVETSEDLLLAGCLCERLARARSAAAADAPLSFNVQAETARQRWREALRSFFDGHPDRKRELHHIAFYRHLTKLLRESDGGRNLVRVGSERDIVAASQIDSLEVVPELVDGVLVPSDARS